MEIAWKIFVEIAWKIFVKTFFFFGDRLKNFCEDLFFFFLGEHLRLCPWSLASSIPVLGLESVCPQKGCPWPRIFFVSLALASSLVSSTPPLAVKAFTLYLRNFGQNHTIKFFAQFSCIYVFWAITSECNFPAQFLARWKRLVFSVNKLLKLSQIFFFAAKTVTQLLKNFFEICHGNSNIIRFVDSLVFFVYRNDTITSSKAKSGSYSSK